MSDVAEPAKLRVFVVDDERVIATTLAAILRSEGFAAEGFLSPIEALKAAEASQPDIVITDVMMPQINGVELGIQLKTKYPACRILLFAGQGATAELLQRARTQGYEFEVLAKPMHPTDLLNAIRSKA